MDLRLKRWTQEQIQDIFKSVSYHPTPTRTEAPDIEIYPLADSLLRAYWANDTTRCNRLIKLCESRAKKAVLCGDLVITTSESLHTAQVGTIQLDGL